VKTIEVTMILGVPPESLGHRERVLARFEDFCTVSQSARAGTPYTVTVKGPDGRMVKATHPAAGRI
jgi:hypothetical protein